MAEPRSTGGVGLGEIAAFMGSEPHPPTIAGSSVNTRFIRKVAELVTARAGLGEAGEFSIFLRSDALFDDVADKACKEVPLLSNGQDPVSGNVWISTAKLGTAFSVHIGWSDQATLYKGVRDLGLGRLPALVVDWRGAKPVGSLYPEGLDHPDDQERVIFSNAPITPPEMKAMLQRFWEKSLRTPGLSVEGHALKIWETAAKGIPAHRPEERIHGRLLDALKARFALHDMRAEPPTDDGRIDVLIWSMTLSAANEPVQRNEWVLELKALTDRTSTDEPVGPGVVSEALQGGLEQAVAYRARTKALRAALCCFDMRKDDVGDATTFATIASEASALSVEVWRWYLYRSTRAARKAGHPIAA